MKSLVQVCGRKSGICLNRAQQKGEQKILSSPAKVFCSGKRWHKNTAIFGILLYAISLFNLISCIHFREKTYLDVYQGEPISFAEMMESLTKARLIYIGENHTLKRHHRFQHDVIRALYQDKIPMAIGLE
ncbi:MAG: ChaN family lipoprotein, partial [Thermodesulfobacteriota bacterium]